MEIDQKRGFVANSVLASLLLIVFVIFVNMSKAQNLGERSNLTKNHRIDITRNLSISVHLSQISVLISEFLDALGHFFAQPDRIQQNMTKGAKRSR
jgi:predicted permease